MSRPNLTVRRAGFSLRLSRREILSAAIISLGLILALAAFTAFGTSSSVSFGQAFEGALGVGGHITDLIVRQFRLPRILEGALLGGALGLSGAVFQSVSRNGLVSPDIIGVDAGAAVVAVLLITTDTSLRYLPELAFAGAMLSAVFVYGTALRGSRLAPNRLILVGIAVNAALGSITTFLIVRSASDNLDNIASAQRWLLGSVDPATWANVRTTGIVLAVALPVVVVLARHLDVMQLGDEASRGLGVRLESTRLALVAVGTVLAATAVSIAGPIGFVAFAAPHIARRIVGHNHPSALVASMLVGALMLSGGDYAATMVIAPSELPVGAMTTVVFCPYFLYLLYRANRRGSVL